MDNRLKVVGAIALVLFVLGLGAYAYRGGSLIPQAEAEFTMPELGVAIAASSTIPDLTYTAQTVEPVGPVLFMTTERIKSRAENCFIGALYKVSNDIAAGSTTPWTVERLEDAANATEVPPPVKKFTDYYLVFEPSQEPCSGEEYRLEEAQSRAGLWDSIQTAREI